MLPESPFLYPILDSGLSTNLLVDAREVIRAGAQILQIRAKKETKRQVYETAVEISELCQEKKVCCILNDCVDIATITKVTGIHLGQSDFPVQDARKLLPQKLIGFSTHQEQQFLAACKEPVDYIAIGPVFQTSTKLNADPSIGLSALSSITKHKTKPVIAIGGIGSDQLEAVLHSNVDGIAIISALYQDGKVYENTSRMLEVLRKHEKV